ncbi:hypothetical protein HLH34_15320 [Gluconacetobacter azotocaptans]|uniref:Uncharacterized protein n=1 Tax=Gluconacetobacter azotocaptans TaxID=142834 RepID=A0A7W4JUT8_9PROT|nr:hypothetical protein [Gluconacetobacter azotocaptans]MBB2191312.1 hypothetical protein [Gluconacetobacter azotocaptans]MBM9403442.1 hypothetical protein [Gluconacetobacter azotocaptans]GBQ28592.1 hypothetical protein AA13594_1039 [Gluconacetobacter azotocaptans DSM 13594]
MSVKKTGTKPAGVPMDGRVAGMQIHHHHHYHAPAKAPAVTSPRAVPAVARGKATPAGARKGGRRA